MDNTRASDPSFDATVKAYGECVDREGARDKAEEAIKREQQRQLEFVKDAAKNGLKTAVKNAAVGKDAASNKDVYKLLHDSAAGHAKESAIDATTTAIGVGDLPANDPALKIAERLATKGYEHSKANSIAKNVGEVNTRAAIRTADRALGQLNHVLSDGADSGGPSAPGGRRRIRLLG